MTLTDLERKLRLLSRAKITNLVLCIDRSHASADGQMPFDGARVVWFQKKVPVDDVLAALSA